MMKRHLGVHFEMRFTRSFYVYTPPRVLAVIRGEIEQLEAEIQGMLGRVFE
jgi:type I restriction enzyme M protein